MSARDVHVNLLTIHSDTVFTKYLRFIMQNPGLTRSQILTGVKGPEFNRPGYNSDYFAYFIQKGLVKYVRAGSKFYYYTTSKGNTAVQCADANGPKKSTKSHTSKIMNVDLPFNYELPEEREKLEQTAALLKEMVAAGAVSYNETHMYFRDRLDEIPEKAITHEEVMALAKKYFGRKAKGTLMRLLQWVFIHQSYTPNLFWVTSRGNDFLKVWPGPTIMAKDAMKAAN